VGNVAGAYCIGIYGDPDEFFYHDRKIKTYQKYNTYRLILVHVIVLACLYYFNKDKVHVRLLYTYICELAVLASFFVLYVKEMFPAVQKKLLSIP